MSRPRGGSSRPDRAMRVVYFAGPGDVARTFADWCRGEPDPREFSIAYSAQFFDVCRALELDALVIAWNPRHDAVSAGRIRVVQRPIPLRKAAGLRYHVGRVAYGLWMAWRCVRFRADAAVISSGTHWIVLAVLRALGVRLVPSVHNTLWSRATEARIRSGVQPALNSWFFRRCCSAILVASAEIGRQIADLTRGRQAPLVEFLPTYRASTFATLRPMDPESSPFRVLYMGRIEERKGVFDLLSECSRLRAAARDVEFDLCGDGTALPRLRDAVREAGLETVFRCHGHCGHEQLLGILGRSHVVAVPTRSTFPEGFAMTVAEGALAGRPVVTSSVCPAVRYVPDAVVEVECDRAESYGDAIAALQDDRSRLRALGEAARTSARATFSDAAGWGVALESVLRAIRDGGSIAPVSRVPELTAAAHASAAGAR